MENTSSNSPLQIRETHRAIQHYNSKIRFTQLIPNMSKKPKRCYMKSGKIQILYRVIIWNRYLEQVFEVKVHIFQEQFEGPGPDGTFQPLPPADQANKDNYAVIEIVDDDPLEKLTEQDVLNEIISTQKFPEKNHIGLYKIYSSQAIAIINPPDFFKLPPILIRIHHIEKHSTFGEEDVIIINLWLETPNGYAYVPVAVFTDSPEAQDNVEKTVLSNTCRSKRSVGQKRRVTSIGAWQYYVCRLDNANPAFS